MKILLCTGIYPPELGGPATYTKLLSDELSKRGHDVQVITYSDSAGEDEKVFRIKRSALKFVHYYRYFRAVKSFGRGFDLFYAQDMVSAGYPTYLAARILKKPFVVKITGDYSWEQARVRGLTKKSIDEFQTAAHQGVIGLIRRIQTHVCKEAQIVITPSEYLKKLAIGWGIKEKKFRVIYNAAPEVPEVSREAHENFRVISVGRDVPWKGFSVLREAVEELKNEIPNINLEILNTTAHDEVLKKISNTDVFVLNSAYEGTSHVTLEAMALGTPVIVSNVGGNPEIVRNNETGLLVEFNSKDQLKSAIRKLQDAGLRQQLSTKARAALQNFTIESMVRETEKELLQCVS